MPASTGTHASRCTSHRGVMVAICGTVLVTSARFLAAASPSAWEWVAVVMRATPRCVLKPFHPRPATHARRPGHGSGAGADGSLADARSREPVDRHRRPDSWTLAAPDPSRYGRAQTRLAAVQQHQCPVLRDLRVAVRQQDGPAVVEPGGVRAGGA